MTRSLASRRTAVGGVLTALLGVALPGMADAKKKKKCKPKCPVCKKCVKGKCKPKPNGTACGSDQTCTGGTCGASACPAGQVRCNGGCIDTATDDANCGACNTACGPDRACQGGTCACKDGLTACGDQCVDLQTSNDHCGACNKTCRQGNCTAGVCVGTGPQGCPAGLDWNCTTPGLACPQRPSCDCATDAQGNAACATFGTPDAFCSDCAVNNPCPAGYVCIKPTTPDCYSCGTIGGTSFQPICA